MQRRALLILVPLLLVGLSTCSKQADETPSDDNSETNNIVTIDNNVNGKADHTNNATEAEHGLDARPTNQTCLAPDRPPSRTAVDVNPAFDDIRLERPVWMQQAPGSPDEDWYVVEQPGRIVAFPNEPATSSKRTVVDMTDVVLFDGELGMLGMAFHPDWPATPQIYLSYNAVSQGQRVSVISRMRSRDGGETLDRDSEEFIFLVRQPFANHNGGQISFGPDGFLYIGLGDGGSADDPQGNGQNTDTVLGAMLRIDPSRSADGNNYAIPSDNPFANGGGAPEIYAHGLRNPWRFSWDRETGELWVGDVGQNAVEEIDIVQLGGNYGWNDKEASRCFATSPCENGPWIDPVVEYSQASNDRSVTGGYVYRGDRIESLRGKYVFADFVSGRMWAAVEDPMTGDLTRQLLSETGINISSFAEGNDGELYFLDYFGGRIFALEPAATGGEDTFPRTLSETGCFDRDDPTRVAEGVLPFSVNAPFWSDGAVKDRYFAIPDGTTIDVGPDGDWDLPIGSVVIKNFTLGTQLFETRLLVRHDDGDWAGYSYEWRDDLSDADLVVGGKKKDVNGQPWIYPSSGDCLNCHTRAAGRTLGLETAQLNGEIVYESTNRISNQVATLGNIGMFSQSVGDPDALDALPDPFGAAPIDDRVRSYLHTNCAQCHRSDGNLRVTFDFRHDTPWSDREVCRAEPTNSDLGVAGATLLTPGDASSSLMHVRMTLRDANGMPPLGSTMPDQRGVDLVREWIDGLDACP